jgi:dimethylargininase
MRFSRAIVRPPGANFADGLSSAGEGAPDLALALRQHRSYCEALRNCGLDLTPLSADSGFPDGTFVEDAAVVTAKGAVITRPGAPSRQGETDSVARALRPLTPKMLRIDAPGTVDGGDVCDVDGHFLIGVSARTNEAGAGQLKTHLEALGYRASVIDIRASKTLLHLKTGMAYVGDGIWVLASQIEQELKSLLDIPMPQVISIPRAESYSANCIRVNDAVLVPSGFALLAAELERRGLRPLPLDMSEYKKMDGGLSCLSLRF